jgi:redox-sensitive bicupin YhaK (pirin superfamily)
MKRRGVERVVKSQPTSDGGGVKLRRSIGTPELDHVDPFLLLDEFKSDEGRDYIAGFPDHPHRGFETVTYMLAGAMRHEDRSGNRGDLVAGSVQWMTAGRGIVHSEMPRQENGLMWGFQLWVNLPARDKMTAPRYLDVAPERIPEVRSADGTRVRVIAGESGGVAGAVDGIATKPLYLDVTVPAQTTFVHPISAGSTGLVYVFEGEAEVGLDEDGKGTRVATGSLAVLKDGAAVAIATGGTAARFLLLAARPIGEPVARYGPFVMNTREEINQALRDLRDGRF